MVLETICQWLCHNYCVATKHDTQYGIFVAIGNAKIFLWKNKIRLRRTITRQRRTDDEIILSYCDPNLHAKLREAIDKLK